MLSQFEKITKPSYVPINKQIYILTPDIEVITQIKYSHDTLRSEQNKQAIE